MCFYVSGEFYSSADGEECSLIRRLLILARKTGISDKRWVVFRTLEVIFAFLRVGHILFFGR